MTSLDLLRYAAHMADSRAMRAQAEAHRAYALVAQAEGDPARAEALATFAVNYDRHATAYRDMAEAVAAHAAPLEGGK